MDLSNNPEDLSSISSAVGPVMEMAENLFGDYFKEVGGAIADRARYCRLENLNKIFMKAVAIMEEMEYTYYNLSQNLKFDVPFVEMASLEEDEYLQEKWARLLISSKIKSDFQFSFVRLLAELQPKEVELLEHMYRTYDGKKDYHSWKTYGFDRKKLIKALNVSEDSFELMNDNLFRLGLCQRVRSQLTKDGEYVIGFTMLGHELVEACSKKAE